MFANAFRFSISINYLMIFTVFAFTIVFFVVGFRYSQEKVNWKGYNWVIYIIFYGYFLAICWISSAVHEILGRGAKWYK